MKRATYKKDLAQLRSKLDEGLIMKNNMKADLYQDVTSVLGNISLKVISRLFLHFYMELSYLFFFILGRSH